MATSFVDPFDTAKPYTPPPAKGKPKPDNNGFIDPFDDASAPVYAEKPPVRGEFSAFGDTPGLMEQMQGGQVNPDQVSPYALATDPLFRGLNNFTKLLTTSDNQAQADILKQSIPGSAIEDSEQGPVIALPSGERRYVNEDGLSGRDLLDFGATVAKYLPAGRLTAGGATLMGRMALGGATSAATSVAEDVSAEQVGSEQGISGAKTALAATGGVFAEGLVPGLQALGRAKTVQSVTQWAGQYLKPLQDAGLVIEGKLTTAGADFVKKLGLDPKAISTRLTTALKQSVDDAVDEKAVPMDAASREFNVRISRGQALQDDAAQALERNIAATDVTTPAGPKMSQFFDDQAKDLIGDTGESGAGLVQSRLSNGNPTLTASSGRSARATINDRIAQAGDTLVASTPAKAAEAKTAIQEAYDAAAAGNVRFNPESVREGIIGVRQKMREAGMDRGLDQFAPTPQAARIDQRLGKLNRWLRPREGKNLKPIDLRMIERERQRINTALNATTNGTDKRVLTIAKQELDSWLDGAVDTAIFSGDPAAIESLKGARGLYAEYQRKYGGKDAVGKLMTRLANGEETATNAINGIFGAGQLGGQKTSVAALERVKSVFGEDSAEWAMMREAAWLKVLQKSVVSSGTKEKFQIGTFLSSYDDAFSGKGRDVMKTLYSPDEIKQMDEFYKFARSLQVPDKVGNPSKTSYAFMQMFQQVAPKMGIAADLSGLSGVGSVISMIGQRTGGKMDWKSAIAGAPRIPYNPALPRAATVAGAIAAPGVIASMEDQEGQ